MGVVKRFSRHRESKYLSGAGPLVRAAFGLTQLQLALLIGVSREALAAEEKKRRDLTGPGGRLLTTLATLVLTLPDAAPPPAPVLPEYDRETLRLRLIAIGLEETRIRLKLARHHTKLAQAQRRRQALPALEAALPPENAYATRWLTQFAEEAASMHAYDGTRAELLSLRLRVLALEADETAKLLGE